LEEVFAGEYWIENNCDPFDYDEEKGIWIVDNYSINGNNNFTPDTYLETFKNVYDEDTAIIPSDETMFDYEELLKKLGY
jgi:hypothetical protein